MRMILVFEAGMKIFLNIRLPEKKRDNRGKPKKRLASFLFKDKINDLQVDY